MNRPTGSRLQPDELHALDAIASELSRARAQVNTWQARESALMHDALLIASGAESRGSATSRAAELPYREVAAELGAVLRVSDRTVQRLMGESATLILRFPATFAAFAAGRISRTHTNVIVDAGAHIDDPATRATYEATLVPAAERESASRIRQLARTIAERVHPRSFTERHEAAASRRTLRVVDLPDGMADLIATVPAVVAHGAFDRINRMARSVRDAAAANAGARRDTSTGAAFGLDASRRAGAGAGAGAGASQGRSDGADTGFCNDNRSIDELRTDIFIDLLLTGDPAAHAGPTGLEAITAHVQVTVPMLSLLGNVDTPATLVGVGPMDAATARRLTAWASGWDRILTDPITGEVLSVDRYTPSKKLKRTLQARDQHCRFPGCRMPVSKSDIDHTIDFALGGATIQENLAYLCRRHHTLKHESAWQVRQLPGGVLEWTSPTGRVYTDIPTSSVMFKPDLDDWAEALISRDLSQLVAAGEAPF